jgi:proline-specific peptidase
MPSGQCPQLGHALQLANLWQRKNICLWNNSKERKSAMERMLKLENGYNIWTKTVGSGSGLPLLLLHGGPGAGHDYLEPLEVLGSERPVIFYDQLGCGKSDKPNRVGLWTIERFADEVQEVRDQLGLDRCHALG